MHFLEPLQGQAEHYLEKLHHKLEKELVAYLKEEQPQEPWAKFRWGGWRVGAQWCCVSRWLT